VQKGCWTGASSFPLCRVDCKTHRPGADKIFGMRGEALPPGGPDSTVRALSSADDARAIVLVEGVSDQIAIETLAARRGRDLATEGVAVVPIGGAQAVTPFVTRFGREDRTGGWPVYATSARSSSSDVASNAPASALTSPARTWSGWASSSASRTSRTS
jgi:hypothetical protein